MRTVDIQALMDSARRKADMVNSQFVSDAELIGFLNEALTEFHDLLVAAYGEDYFFDSTTAATTADLASYALPANFYKLLGVFIELNASSGQYFPVGRFMGRDSQRLQVLGSASPSAVKYALRGGNLIFAPAPNVAVNYKLEYTPTAPVLAKIEFASTDVNTATNRITMALHGLVDKSMCTFTTAGTLATGLTAGQLYYVNVVDLNTITVALTPGGAAVDITAAGAGNSTLLSVFDGIDGWEQFLTTDAAIQMKDKEESDTRVLRDRKKAMIERLTAMAASRDTAEPKRAVDVDDHGYDYDPMYQDRGLF